MELRRAIDNCDYKLAAANKKLRWLRNERPTIAGVLVPLIAGA